MSADKADVAKLAWGWLLMAAIMLILVFVGPLWLLVVWTVLTLIVGIYLGYRVA